MNEPVSLQMDGSRGLYEKRVKQSVIRVFDQLEGNHLTWTPLIRVLIINEFSFFRDFRANEGKFADFITERSPTGSRRRITSNYAAKSAEHG